MAITSTNIAFSRAPARLAIVSLMLLSGCVPGCLVDDIEKYTAKSEFVFIGTVDVLDASTMQFPADADLAIVSVTLPLKAPVGFPFSPQTITLAVRDLNTLSKGQKRLFFARSWIFGESLALKEVASARLTWPFLYRQKLGQFVNLADSVNVRRIDSLHVASVGHVVIGQVVSISEDTLAHRTNSERDPLWWSVTVQIDSVLKGSLVNTARVSFPSSTGPFWHHVPKLVPDEHYVLILHLDEPFLSPAPHPAIVDENDVWAPADAGHISSLIP